MKIRVLHIVLSLEVGGLENGVVNLINHQTKSDFQVDVLCLRRLGPLADRIYFEGARVWFKEPAANSVLSSLIKILELCREIPYDIIHSHSWGTLVPSFLGKTFSAVPFIVHGEHGSIAIKKRTHRIAQRILLRRVDQLLSVSDELSQLLIKQFVLGDTSIKTIINGVDTQNFRPSLESRQAARSQLGFNKNQVIIGSVGRLQRVKNYQELIVAFSIAYQKNEQLRLIFVGVGELHQNLKYLAQQHGVEKEVVFLGQRDNVAELLNAMDIFALTSLSEGMSNSILEAMACGLPIIASDVGGNLDLVGHEKNGFLYPLHKTEVLANYIIQLSKDPEKIKAFGQQSRLDSEERFSLYAMVKNYEGLYQDLIASKSTVKAR